jgi:hypothetical protein
MPMFRSPSRTMLGFGLILMINVVAVPMIDRKWSRNQEKFLNLSTMQFSLEV